MNKTKAYTAPPGTQVRTSVDPMGLSVLVVFDEDGRFETSDPGLIAVLDKLAARPRHPVKHEQVEESE